MKKAMRNLEIHNTQECFVQLWLRLEHTRQLLKSQNKRFCVRNILRLWYGTMTIDGLPAVTHLTFEDFVWEVCQRTVVDNESVCGWDVLPPPVLYPRKHRELLRAVVTVALDITIRKASLKELDAAYSIAFPNSTPLNVNKKKRTT